MRKKTRIYHKRIKEKEVVRYIQENLGGQTEVFLGFSIADLVIGNYILEVKKFERWKELLGQMLVHKVTYPYRPVRGVIFCLSYPPCRVDFVYQIFRRFGFKIWIVTDELLRKRISASTSKNKRRSTLAFSKV